MYFDYISLKCNIVLYNLNNVSETHTIKEPCAQGLFLTQDLPSRNLTHYTLDKKGVLIKEDEYKGIIYHSGLIRLYMCHPMHKIPLGTAICICEGVLVKDVGFRYIQKY